MGFLGFGGHAHYLIIFNLRFKVLLLLGVCAAIKSQVVEVDDSFQEKKQNYAWLLEFYAPWCGHCRKLEPAYHQVYLGLKGSPIIVAKVDATRYPSLASAYDVRGYPTVKFIQGDKVINYNGDRTKEDIIEFAKKAFGPSVSPLENMEKFSNTRHHLSQNVFFLYLPQSLDNPNLDSDFDVYKQVAEKYAISNYFFFAHKNSLPEDVIVSKVPSILVFKDGKHFEYKDTIDNLEKWVNGERFPLFPIIGGVGLNEMTSLDKMLVIYVHDQQSSQWQGVVLNVAQKQEIKFNRYQFVWLRDVDVGNNIIMSNLDPPFLFVFNSSDHHFFPFPFDSMSEESLENFLQDVTTNKYPAHGGKGWVERVKRLIYDIVMTIYSIYKESLWLALLVFGVPLLVISIVCYTLCCIEPTDDAVYEDSFEDEQMGRQGDEPEDVGTKKVQ